MSHYTLEELIERWKKEAVTVEQVIGQVLLVLRDQQERLRTLERGRPPDAGNVGAPGRRQK